ncbi:uncharacterized protein [Haliotis asinina]|uniref:uncharacterized protein n=1 Tax=Haliotis asinina TaxID=109174 RepID=UPI003531C625
MASDMSQGEQHLQRYVHDVIGDLDEDTLNSIVQDLERGKRLNPSAQQDLVRLFVDAVRKKTNHATRSQMSVIAQRMTARYPDSLMDNLDGSIIGSGYDSILNKLVSRNENLNRNASSMCLSRKKRPLAYDNSGVQDTGGTPAAATAERRDSYGCINWMPLYTGDSDAMEIQKQSLKAMFDDSDTDDEKVMHLMKATYALQHKEINSGTSMEELKRNWPYLFHVKGLLDHAKELLEIDVRNALGSAYTDKAVRINRFFKSKSSSKYEMIYDEAKRQSEKDNIKAWLVAVILCVLNHFGENEKDVFFVVDHHGCQRFTNIFHDDDDDDDADDDEEEDDGGDDDDDDDVEEEEDTFIMPFFFN